MWRKVSLNCIAIAALALLTAGTIRPTIAADLPVKARPLPAPPVFSWSGFYIGGHSGYGWARKEWIDPFGPPFGLGSHTARGGFGGVQAGYNYQTAGGLVLGVEGQFSWADLKGHHINPFDLADTLTTKESYLATPGGRIGYAFDRVLVYGKGGAAWTRDRHNVIDLGIVERTASATRSGWMLGAGLEYAFWNSWSAKLEYNYMDFGTRRLTFVSLVGGPSELLDIRQTVHAVLLGVNYRFSLLP